MPRRSWKLFVLAFVVVASAAVGFFVPSAEAARCEDLKVCCPGTTFCMSCYTGPRGCSCPTITCPP
jgi:hypothetical protein